MFDGFFNIIKNVFGDAKEKQYYKLSSLKDGQIISEDYFKVRREIVGKSYEASNSNPIYQALISSNMDFTVGSGFRIEPKINNDILNLDPKIKKELESKIKMLWDIWSGNSNLCDYYGDFNFKRLQIKAYYNALVYGDVFTLFKVSGDDFKIRLISGSEVYLNNGQIKEGVELNKNGIKEAFYIGDKKVNIKDKNNNLNISQYYIADDINTIRGIPYGNGVFSHMETLIKYSEAELNASTLSAKVVMAIKSMSKVDAPVGMRSVKKASDLKNETSEPTNSSVLKMDDKTYSTAINLKPNEDFEVKHLGKDRGDFDKFYNVICTTIASAKGMSVELLRKQFNSSYSASRAAIAIYKKLIKPNRDHFSDNFIKPIYSEFIKYLVSSEKLDLPDFFKNEYYTLAYCECIVKGDTLESINPEKDINAKAKGLRAGITTIKDILIDNSSDETYSDLIEQRVKEEELLYNMRKEAGLPTEETNSNETILVKKEDDDE